MKIGVIGTGRVGNLFAKTLIKAMHQVMVMDVKRVVYENLTGLGAEAAQTPVQYR